MNYILMPSLEHIALVKVVIALWNENDVRSSLAKFNFPLIISRNLKIETPERRSKWREMEDKVAEKASHLPLPQSIKEEVLNFIQPVGLQIRKWKEYHQENCYLCIDFPDQFCWTPQGTINLKKTAELLVKDENLDVMKRYKLACIYCLEDDIRSLWNKMPENCKNCFYCEKDPKKVHQQKLVTIWTYEIVGERSRIEGMIHNRRPGYSLYQYACRYSAVIGNRTAAEYFLKKLTHEERERSLIRFAKHVALKCCEFNNYRSNFPKEHYSDVLCFLLSQMNEMQQIEVFKAYPSLVLTCLLDWPWQGFIMPTLKCMWPFINEDGLDFFLHEVIYDKIIPGCRYHNYRKFVRTLWENSPDIFKKHFRSNEYLLSNLFMINDIGIIKLVLKETTPAEREAMIFCRNGKSICETLILRDNWNLLKFFIEECISSKEKMIKFTGELKRCVHSRSKHTKVRERWAKYFELLDNFIQSSVEKENVEEVHNNSATKHCNTKSEEEDHVME